MENNPFSSIYIQTEGAWEKEGQCKFGYTGTKKYSLLKRLYDSHEQHSYQKKLLMAYKIKETKEYILGFKNLDDIIKLILYHPEIIEELEKDYNCEFEYGRRLNYFKVQNGGGEEFIQSEGLPTLYYFIEQELKKLGLTVERYSEKEIKEINEKNRSKIESTNDLKNKDRNIILEKYRALIRKKEKERVKKPIARGIQNDILKLDYFKHNDKGTLILPCGVGKSILSLFLNEQTKSKRTIIGVPSLNLVRQFKKECLKFKEKNRILCVGSIYNNKINNIKDFLEGEGVIITTYHSAKKILNLDVEFDFKIGDECHHLVGEKFKPSKDETKEISDFKKFLEIKSTKSLFMTATPKFIEKYNEKDGTSMDNTNIFGKVIYKESVKWAIENKYITDYYLEVIRNTESELDRIIDDIGINVDHKELFFSALMSLKSLERNPKLSHLLIYANTIESADIVEFYIKQILEKEIISFPCENIYHKSLHSQVKDFNIEREKKEFTNSKYGIISCVQIFGEGVDIPKLNGVVVAEHMESEIRIVQSLLRPHRLEKGNPDKDAFIICPFIDNLDGLNNKSFNKVKQIVKEMRNCDDLISSKINLTEFKKRDGPCNPKSNILPELVEGDGANLKMLKTRLRKAKCLASDLSEEEEDYQLSQEINKANNIISKQEYLEDRDRVLFIENPEGYFKKHALWKGWYDFLGIETKKFIQTKDEWIKFCKEKNVKSVDMYNKLCSEYAQLPREPSELYLGFTNICNELGLFSRRR